MFENRPTSLQGCTARDARYPLSPTAAGPVRGLQVIVGLGHSLVTDSVSCK